MSIVTTPSHRSEIVYRDRDGQPIAENTLQFTWIVTIKKEKRMVEPCTFVSGTQGVWDIR